MPVDKDFTILTPTVLSGGNLLEPRAFSKTDVPKFSAFLAFEPNSEQLLELARRMIALAQENGVDASQLGPFVNLVKTGEQVSDTLSWCLKDGNGLVDAAIANFAQKNGRTLTDDEAKDDREGKVILVARSQYPVQLSLVKASGITDLDTDPLGRTMAKQAFTRGNKVLAQIKLNWHKATPLAPAGINAFLQRVCSTGQKVPFNVIGAGVTTSREAFKGYVGQPTMVDPLAGLEGGFRNGNIL